jgi:hypothetical protein
MNSVKQPKDVTIKYPTRKKVFEIQKKANYVELNKLGMRQVHSLN